MSMGDAVMRLIVECNFGTILENTQERKEKCQTLRWQRQERRRIITSTPTHSTYSTLTTDSVSAYMRKCSKMQSGRIHI